MLVVASNESIFDAMGRMGNGSDAGMVRTFELVVEPFQSERNKAELSMLFESLHSNYGHAGAIFAKYIAANADAVRTFVERTFSALAAKYNMQSQERFWFSIITSLIAGAKIAKQLNLVSIDTNTLGNHLFDTLDGLRKRTSQQVALSGPAEILAAFMAQFQDSVVTVDVLPKRKQPLGTYKGVMIGAAPRTDRLKYIVSQSEDLMRVSYSEFIDFIAKRHLPVADTISKLTRNYGVKKMVTALGIGTKWRTIPIHVLEFNLVNFGMTASTVAVPSSLAGMSGSHELTGHAGSTPPPSPP